jgi:hypothetical protein
MSTHASPHPHASQEPEPSRHSAHLEDLSPTPEVSVQAKEKASVAHLMTLIEAYAPHLHKSFVCSEPWWERYIGTPQAHVRLKNRPLVFTNLC